MAHLNQPHRTFTTEFKLSIIDEYLSGNSSIAQLSSQYDLDARMVRRWVNKFQTQGKEGVIDQRGKQSAGGRPKIKYDSELEYLRKEVLRLKGENFLLKKLKNHLKKQKK